MGKSLPLGMHQLIRSKIAAKTPMDLADALGPPAHPLQAPVGRSYWLWGAIPEGDLCTDCPGTVSR